ncbi:hypothetical protein N0V90_002021 [Kalmusia sp. IMI 367209]|nr:hypothetical protein N0V90_002021 [Kalmusia sp. IMI 367209]
MSDSDSMSSETDGSCVDDESIGSLVDEEEFKIDLRECLDDVEYEGSFFNFHSFSSYVNPGLHIANYGSVGLPLTVRDAEAIARICSPSPFGKGSHTVIDTSVRKTWELDFTSFECRNPAWVMYLDSIVKQTVEELGVQVPARVERYKLLLYETGAFFKAHKDSEKSPGMFGTLVICLPSEHTGGEVHLVRGGKTSILETAKRSQYDLSTLAWYSDVEHEIKPVASGYRLVLTYNLLQDQRMPRQTASMLDESHARLEKLLRTWNKELYFIDKLIYPLEHQYTEASLSLKSLKGRDAAKARYIESLCTKNGVFWFLGRMTKQTSEDSRYEHEDEDEGLSLDWIVTPAGEKLSLGIVDVSEDQMLADADDLYAGRDADSEDEGEFTGNESMPSTFRYRDTVLILCRKDDIVRQFSLRDYHGAASLQTLFELFRNDSTADSSEESAEVRKNAFRSILDKAIKAITGTGLSYYYSSYGLESERSLADFGRIFEMVADFLLLYRAGLTRSPPVFTFKHANEMRFTFELIQSHLHSNTSAFDEWKSIRLGEMLHAVKSYDKLDVPALLQLVPAVTPETYFEIILPTLINSPNRAGLAGFLCQLGTKSTHDPSFRDTIARPTYQKILQAVSLTFTLDLSDFTRSSDYGAGYDSEYLSPDTSDAVTGYCAEYLDIYDQFMALELHSEALVLIDNTLPDLPGSNSPFWKEWRALFAFIERFASILERHHKSDMNNASQNFIGSALRTSAYSLAEACPTEPKDWRRMSGESINCNCGPCLSLAQFLADPHRAVGRFSYAEKTRKHLQYSLNYEDFKFDTERGRTPYTLVVHKTNNEFSRLTAKWKGDITEMESRIRDMNTGFLKSLLGEELSALTEIIGEGRKLKSRAPQSKSLRPIPASTQNSRATGPVAGVKRKAEVIDLTDGAFE